jgi:4-hydroxybenzoate polyprenyltransferase
VRLGQRRAILVAKLLHGITIPALALFGSGAGFGIWYYAGLVAAAGILAYEHRLVRPGNLSRLDAAFFTMNGVMSVTVFVFALADRIAG